MVKNKVKFFIALIIEILLFIFLILIFYHFFIKKKEVTGSNSIVKRNKTTYFLLAVDISASMNKTDPKNFEAEALKDVIHAIYYSNKIINKVSNRAKVKIITFSGKIHNLTSKDVWLTLDKEKSVIELDTKISNSLAKRDGNYTDLNIVINYLLNEVKRIKEADINFVLNLFTDGKFYPDFRNRINHKTEEDYEKYLELIENAKGKLSYYDINEKYGILNVERMNFAKKIFQVKMKKKIRKSPIQLNIISLNNEDIEYLKNWTKDVGELFIINKPSDIGKSLLDIFSKNLYTGFESGKISYKNYIKFQPFTNDILETILILFNDDGFDKDNNSGKLNKQLLYSKIITMNEKSNKDFHNKQGIRLNLNKKYNLNWNLITIHDNYLSFEPVINNVNDDRVIYKIALKNIRTNKIIPKKDFKNKLKIDIKTSFPVKCSDMNKDGYILADFSNFNEGYYLVQLKIIDGQLKKDFYPLRKRIFSYNIEIKPKFLFYEKNKKINKITLEPLDRR